ncbi:MAG: SAM-dependent methyltransferase [Pirellulaceae bacterium]|nr:SAM-dependent methyltransferase [Pirellulaceae bacterium]
MTLPSVQDSAASSQQISPEQFAFLVCQPGTEAVLKREFASPSHDYRLAFSRPGLLTLKANEGRPGQPLALPAHPLIRRAGWVLGQIRGGIAQPMLERVLELATAHGLADSQTDMHVFQRDSNLPGHGGFEPGITPLAEEIAHQLGKIWPVAVAVNGDCVIGQQILNVIIVEPDYWIVGQHTACDTIDCWPGGVARIIEPELMVSRAYLKMAEAIRWSQLSLQAGDAIVEIGSAPGGATQCLLDMGLRVTGVDPAEMDPSILEHPRFTHWRSKAAGVKRRGYREFRWLAADANVAPNYTLDLVEDIVNYPTSRLEGLLLTLKLPSFDLLEHLEDYVKRIRSWHMERVQVRQLAHNRRELCVVAARKA